MVDYQEKLSKVKEKNNTLGEYIKEFIDISNKFDGLSESYLTSCFISGLRHSVELELLAKQQKITMSAIRLARLEEEKYLM